VWVYRPGGTRWSPGPTLPIGLDDPAVVSDGPHLYVLGGWTGQQTSDKTFVLNSPNGSWHPYVPLPQPRSAGAAAWDGTRIVFGGGDYKGPHNDVWALPPNGTQWLRLKRGLARSREHLTAAANTTYESVWFIGGSDQKGAVSYSDVDISTGYTVRSGAALARPVQGGAAVPVRTGFCVLGGFRGGFVLGEVQCRTTGVTFPNFKPGRSKLGAAILNHWIYAVGGHTGTNVAGSTIVQAIKVP
jgi:hypothetical protein